MSFSVPLASSARLCCANLCCSLRPRPSTSHRTLHSSLDGLSPLQSDPLPFSSSTSSRSVLKSNSPQTSHGMGPHPDNSGDLSDQEWEIRTGRAIYILQQTLPTFFSTGLISSLDSLENSQAKSEDQVSIYSPNIRLEHTPPTPFPPPFPRTLHVEGLPLYLGSSVFVRHSLNALYTDLRVELQRVRVHGPHSSSGLRPDALDPDGLPRLRQGRTRSIREKSLFVGLVAHGINRVSKAEGGWQVNSTYTFSPTTGLIHLHTIDSIHPAPHQAFFSALQAALGKIGLGGPQGAGAGGSMSSSQPHAAPSTSSRP